MTRQRETLFSTGPRPVKRLRKEADRTLRALGALGRLEEVDRGLVAAYRTAADLADERRDDPEAAYHLTAALKLFVEIDGRLRGLGALETDDGFARLLEAATGSDASTAAPSDPPPS